MADDEKGLDIGRMQSMLNHEQNASGEEAENILSVLNMIFHYVKEIDFSSHVVLGLDKAISGMFNFLGPTGLGSFLSEGDPNKSVLGFPNLLKMLSEISGGDGTGAEQSQAADTPAYNEDNELGAQDHASNNQRDSSYDPEHESDHPNVDRLIRDTAGEDFGSKMQHSGDVSPVQEHVPPPPVVTSSPASSWRHHDSIGF